MTTSQRELSIMIGRRATLRLGGDEVQEARHRLNAVEQIGVHVHVEQVGAGLYLVERDCERALPVVRFDQPPEGAEPVTFVRSPTMTNVASSLTISGSSPRNAAASTAEGCAAPEGRARQSRFAQCAPGSCRSSLRRR